MNAVEYYQDYIAHYGTKGQEWGKRHYQSYETAPTRSGMVGTELGEAAKQRSRKEERQDEITEKWRNKLTSENDKYFNSQIKAQTNAANRLRAKAEKTTNARKIENYERQAGSHEASIRNLEKIHKYANEATMKMSYKDVKKEKLNRAGDVLAEMGGVAAGFAMGAMGAPIAIYTFGMGRQRRRNRMINRGINEAKRQNDGKFESVN